MKLTKFLEKTKLDVWTVNKAIQKIRESLRVTKEEKEKILILKRKNNTLQDKDSIARAT